MTKHYVRDRAEGEKLRRRNVCCECGGELWLYLDQETDRIYLDCHYQHEAGIAREYEQPSEAILHTRRMQMTQNTALEKYHGVTSLTKVMATEILEALWPEAPQSEKARAALLCQTQQLNPLMHHVFIIPFNKGKQNESWATVIGINAKRLMASRKGSFSYIDDTPRVMTEEEQMRVFGKFDTKNLVVLVRLQDPRTGASVPGYGKWPLKKKVWKDGKAVEADNDPYGTDKGNSMFNMASIRAESQALNRLRPGDMPQDIPVIDEAFAEEAGEEPKFDVESTGRTIDTETGEIIEPETVPEEEHDSEEAIDELVPEVAKKEKPKSRINMDELRSMMDTLHWKDATVISYLGNTFHVDKAGELEDVLARLSDKDQEVFIKQMQSKVELA